MPSGCKVHSHIVDSRFFRRGYCTDEARRIFCDFRRLQRWLEVEVALANCQAELGIIPGEAASELTRTAHLEQLDLKAIQSDIARTGHSLIPLLNAWQKVSSPEAGQYIHFGPTTQDIQDTAQILEVRDALDLIERDLGTVIRELSQLASKHRDLAIIGRTHGQHALPTTLGLKIAIWLDEALRNFDRLRQLRERVLVSQLFGGVGTMASLSPKGITLLANFSARLGLAAPDTAWHGARDRLVEFTTTLATLMGSLGKIANEICQLARNEIGEFEEPFHQGKIGSSTMPHKRNPELCEQVVVLAKLVKSNASLAFDTLINEHERDYRSVRLEWITITESSLFTCGALNLMRAILKNLIVHEDRIGANLERAACLVSTEALMFLLAEKIGKQNAHHLIYQASMQTHATQGSLLELLMEQPEVRANFSPDLLTQAISPANHIGLAQQLTDQVVAKANLRFPGPPPALGPTVSCPLAGHQGCPGERDFGA